MMRLILLFTFLSAISSADILYVSKDRCILDNYYFQSGRFYYTYSATNENAFSYSFQTSDLEYGYEYIDNKCQKMQILQDTGMTYSHYKFMIALVGLLLGFTLFFFTVFIFTKRVL